LPDYDNVIWSWNKNKPFKNEYRVKECVKPVEHRNSSNSTSDSGDEDKYDIYSHEHRFEIELIKNTLNEPRLANIWNMFGLGWVYGKRYWL